MTNLVVEHVRCNPVACTEIFRSLAENLCPLCQQEWLTAEHWKLGTAVRAYSSDPHPNRSNEFVKKFYGLACLKNTDSLEKLREIHQGKKFSPPGTVWKLPKEKQYQTLLYLGKDDFGPFELALDENGHLQVLHLLPLVQHERMIHRFRARQSIVAGKTGILAPSLLEADSSNQFWVSAIAYLPGMTLQEILREQKSPVERGVTEVLYAGANILAGLQKEDIVLRDIKPGTIFVTLNGDFYFISFGLAKLQKDNTEETWSADEKQLTLEQSKLGTLAYMSPQQAEDPRSVTTRDDVFSLGLVGVKVLTGKNPFIKSSARASLEEVLGYGTHDSSEFLLQGIPDSVPLALRECLAAMVHPKREQRPDPAEVLERLHPLLPQHHCQQEDLSTAQPRQEEEVIKAKGAEGYVPFSFISTTEAPVFCNPPAAPSSKTGSIPATKARPVPAASRHVSQEPKKPTPPCVTQKKSRRLGLLLAQGRWPLGVIGIILILLGGWDLSSSRGEKSVKTSQPTSASELVTFSLPSVSEPYIDTVRINAPDQEAARQKVVADYLEELLTNLPNDRNVANVRENILGRAAEFIEGEPVWTGRDWSLKLCKSKILYRLAGARLFTAWKIAILSSPGGEEVGETLRKFLAQNGFHILSRQPQDGSLLQFLANSKFYAFLQAWEHELPHFFLTIGPGLEVYSQTGRVLAGPHKLEEKAVRYLILQDLIVQTCKWKADQEYRLFFYGLNEMRYKLAPLKYFREIPMSDKSTQDWFEMEVNFDQQAAGQDSLAEIINRYLTPGTYRYIQRGRLLYYEARSPYDFWALLIVLAGLSSLTLSGIGFWLTIFQTKRRNPASSNF